MIATPIQTLQEAVACHQRGRLDEAARLYGAVLEAEPGTADAWHLLGQIRLSKRDFSQARMCVAKAIRFRPDLPAFHTTLGDVFAAESRWREAALCYQEAVRLDQRFVAAWVKLGDLEQNQGRMQQACNAYLRAIESAPESAEAYNNLANALVGLGRLEEARECFREALRLAPHLGEAAVNLSSLHLRLGQATEAEEWSREALRIRPDLTPALANLGTALLDQQRYAEAEQCARRALARAPGTAQLHSNLGAILLHQKRWEEAERECRLALAMEPGHAGAALNLGVVLESCGRLEEAAGQFQDVLEADPCNASAWTNLGTVRETEGRHDAALFCYEEALRRQPDHPKARFCRSLEWLGRGMLEQGLAEYEWRWKVARAPRASSGPLWDGDALEGRTILLWAEQGLGDTIQFARYIPLVAARGGRVIVESQPGAAPIVRTVDGAASVVTPDDPLPAFDVQASLVSLARIFHTVPETIPDSVPYVTFEAALAARLRERLGQRCGLRVGLAWAGNPENAGDRRRSMRLEKLLPLRAIPEVEWFSLHIGAAARDAVQECGGWVCEVLSDGGGLVELAALMSLLDLVITVDTMPAHLAGAMGRPVWNLLCYAPDWRWLRTGDRTRWYPTMRLFRQPAPGDWESVVEAVASALRNFRTQESGGRSDTEN